MVRIPADRWICGTISSAFGDALGFSAGEVGVSTARGIPWETPGLTVVRASANRWGHEAAPFSPFLNPQPTGMSPCAGGVPITWLPITWLITWSDWTLIRASHGVVRRRSWSQPGKNDVSKERGRKMKSVQSKFKYKKIEWKLEAESRKEEKEKRKPSQWNQPDVNHQWPIISYRIAFNRCFDSRKFQIILSVFFFIFQTKQNESDSFPIEILRIGWDGLIHRGHWTVRGSFRDASWKNWQRCGVIWGHRGPKLIAPVQLGSLNGSVESIFLIRFK